MSTVRLNPLIVMAAALLPLACVQPTKARDRADAPPAARTVDVIDHPFA